jgi:hypothetical protein
MKDAVMIIYLAGALLISGCAHKMSVEEITSRYAVTVSTNTSNTVYESNENNQLDAILKRVTGNLQSKFAAATSGRNKIKISIEVTDYGYMLKHIPITRHWVSYKVDVMAGNQVLGTFVNDDGQPDVPDIVKEMTENIYKFSLETMQAKLGNR